MPSDSSAVVSVVAAVVSAVPNVRAIRDGFALIERIWLSCPECDRRVAGFVTAVYMSGEVIGNTTPRVAWCPHCEPPPIEH